jgi:hypothetical protein
MNQNNKPQGFSLGSKVIDGESITDNVTAIDLLSAKSKWSFGKSSPIVTDSDILERALLTDSNYCNAIERASEHLRAQGFAACWSRDDVIRYHLHKMKSDLLARYAGAK